MENWFRGQLFNVPWKTKSSSSPPLETVFCGIEKELVHFFCFTGKELHTKCGMSAIAENWFHIPLLFR